MKDRRAAIFAVVSLLTLVVAGAEPARAVSVTESVSFFIKSPVGSDGGAARLTCARHMNCATDPPIDGNALDWAPDMESGTGTGTCCLDPPDSDNARSVYYRGKGFRSQRANGSVLRIGSTNVWDKSAVRECFATEVEIWQMITNEGNYAGEARKAGFIQYAHTSAAAGIAGGWWIEARHEDWGGQYKIVRVGTMVVAEKQGCPWTGPHVHQDLVKDPEGLVTWTINAAYPLVSTCGQSQCAQTYQNPEGSTTPWYLKDDWVITHVNCAPPVCQPPL